MRSDGGFNRMVAGWMEADSPVRRHEVRQEVMADWTRVVADRVTRGGGTKSTF